jgi:hypothetical protein
LQLQVNLINNNRRSGQLSAHDFRFLALCFHTVGDHRQAYIAWREALSLEPDDAVTKAHLALSAAKHGRIDESILLAAQAVKDRPESWPMLISMPVVSRKRAGQGFVPSK